MALCSHSRTHIPLLELNHFRLSVGHGKIFVPADFDHIGQSSLIERTAEAQLPVPGIYRHLITVTENQLFIAEMSFIVNDIDILSIHKFSAMVVDIHRIAMSHLVTSEYKRQSGFITEERNYIPADFTSSFRFGVPDPL